MKDVLFDPQTSGGLLMAVPREKLSSLLEGLKKRGQSAWVIGEVKEGSGRIKVFGDGARLP
jgi:selenide,water dikinase